MNALKVGLGMLAIVAAAAMWVSYRPDGVVGEAGSHISIDKDSSSGFVSVPMPDGLSTNGIVIFAPQNCPSDAARRAEKLAGFLDERGIGFTRSQSASYNSLTSKQEAQRVIEVMNGDIPIVYVNGRAKANPTPEEVEAEYRRSDS